MSNLINKSNIKNILLWLTIIVLAILCFYLWWSSKKHNENLIGEVQYVKSPTQYVAVTDDKSLNELKKENKALYDSIKKLSNVKEAIQVKYVYKYETDTVVMTKDNLICDSLYHYSNHTDSIKYDLDIQGKDVNWFKLNFALQDSLMIVTRSHNGQNETTVTHSPNTEITDVTVFVPKKTFMEKVKEHTYFGVGISAGYGIITKKPDIFVGVGVGVKF